LFDYFKFGLFENFSKQHPRGVFFIGPAFSLAKAEQPYDKYSVF